LIAHRLSRGQSPCSAETGAYCQARKRLPEKFFADVARQTGRALEANVDPRWLWKRRRVYVYDGSSVSMPDTPENQAEYPQPVVQQPGLGFPLARIAAVFSLACGAVLDLGLCRYAGKGQSELGMLRTVRLQVQQPGFRVRTIIVATTWLDAKEVTKDELGQLYRARWNAELDLRSLKQTMQMDVVRCKTPGLVRKEIWTHVLAYNLIRTIIAQAAGKHGIEPRSISFKGAVQTLEAFQGVIALQGQHDWAFRMNLYQQLLDAIASHRVADRPDRFEPRRIKRRPKPYDRLMKPRHQAKRAMLKGL
jgi:hypothetical protein